MCNKLPIAIKLRIVLDMMRKVSKKPIFTIISKDTRTQARAGTLHTSHGTIDTPAYVIVATRGRIRTLEPSDIAKTKTQVVIANAYHLRQELPKQLTTYNLQLTKNQKKTFLLKKLGVQLPTMTDSGGFQVFSFGAAKEFGTNKFASNSELRIRNKELRDSSKVKITENGVSFLLDGKRTFLSPENSMRIQERIGADIIFAFDECTSPLHPYEYTRKSMERTHRWAVRCLKKFQKSKIPGRAGKNQKYQMLFGIVQGGRYNSLRAASAKFIAILPFDGFGIGGSFGKNEMQKTLKSVIPHLPELKPRHLLGIGRIEDIFTAVENGIDTFDCVIPTREARHARIYAQNGYYNILRSEYEYDKRRLAPRCKCWPCTHNITRAKLRKLFKDKDDNAGRYATIHNVWFFNDLMEKIRTAITQGKFKELQKKHCSL